MSGEMLHTMATVSMILAIMFLAVGIILYFRLDMADIWGFLSRSPKHRGNQASEKKHGSRKKQKKEKPAKKKKKKSVSSEPQIHEDWETVQLVPSDHTNATIKLNESALQNSDDESPQTMLLIQDNETSEFKIEFEIGFAESLDVIE